MTATTYELVAAQSATKTGAQVSKVLTKHVVVMGAGVAGLAAPYELQKLPMPVTVLESDPRYVGGIARTITHDGYRFHRGGHRFFGKSQEMNAP